jgi:hypothetical protein
MRVKEISETKIDIIFDRMEITLKMFDKYYLDGEKEHCQLMRYSLKDQMELLDTLGLLSDIKRNSMLQRINKY